MIDPKYCQGCDFWRPIGGGDSNFACNYAADGHTPSRTKLGALDVCSVKSTKLGLKFLVPVVKKPIVPNRPRGDLYMKWYKQGLTDREVAEKTGTSISAVGNWRCRNGLPVNKKKKPEPERRPKVGDPCQRCYSKAMCKQMGGTCNEKAMWDGAPNFKREQKAVAP